MILRAIVRAAAWPVRCLGLYLVWCFRVGVRAILLASGEEIERGDD